MSVATPSSEWSPSVTRASTGALRAMISWTLLTILSLVQLAPALERDAAIDGRESHRQQVEADHVGQQRLRRRDTDLRPRVQIDRAVGVTCSRARDDVRHRDAERAALLGLV